MKMKNLQDNFLIGQHHFLKQSWRLIFDGADSMQMLKEEQARLLLRQMSEILLRQHAKTAGRTYHSDRRQLLPNLHHQ